MYDFCCVILIRISGVGFKGLLKWRLLTENWGKLSAQTFKHALNLQVGYRAGLVGKRSISEKFRFSWYHGTNIRVLISDCSWTVELYQFRTVRNTLDDSHRNQCWTLHSYIRRVYCFLYINLSSTAWILILCTTNFFIIIKYFEKTTMFTSWLLFASLPISTWTY